MLLKVENNNSLPKMSGYRCVNYYELCRLCTASQGTKKVHIFSEEAKKTNLLEKISNCLPIVVSENDKLPKIVCAQCLSQVESIVKFRESCVNAQTMLESCLNSSKLRNGEKVYIKDVSRKKPPSSPPQLVKTISNAATTTAMVKAGLPLTIGKTTLTKAPVQKNSTSSDFLSSIIQAVGIQNVDETNEPQIIQQANIQQVQSQQQPIQQYTITLDGQTLKTNQIHYKIEPSGAISIQEPYVQQITTPATTQQTAINNTSLAAQVDEFLKLKTTTAKASPTTTTTTMIAGQKRKEQTVKVSEASPAKKQQKINWVLASPMVQTQQPKVQTQSTTLTSPNTLVANAGPKTQTISLQDLKFYSNNKCLVPLTVKDGSNNDQQVMAQIDSKNLVLPGATYVQMKLQPQLTTVDGQQVLQLTSATSLPTSISLAPNQPQFVQSQIQLPQQIQQIQQTSNVQTATIQQGQIVPETRTIFTTSSGQNVTLTHHPIQQINTSNADQGLHTSTVETSAGKVQLTTLQNVATPNITHPLPQSSAITFQRIKVESADGGPKPAIATNTTKKPTNQRTFKLTTIQNSGTAGKGVVAKKPATNRIVVTTAKAPTVQTPAAITTTTARTTTTTTTSGDAPKTEVPTCEICDKVFKRKEHLAQHLKLHLGLRPFKCEEPNCNKTFSRKEHLMRHCVSHTGKKQFDCEFCHKLFSRKDNLNKHKRSHKQVQQPDTVVYTVTEVS